MKASDLRWMRRAIELARSAREKGNHPFGAVLVDEHGQLLMEAENTVFTDNDPTAHPEAKLAKKAATAYDRQFVGRCTMYASTEPCPMCAAVMAESNLRRVRYGVSQERFAALLARGEEEKSQPPSRQAGPERERAIEAKGPILEEEALQVHEGFWT
jgi:tRNA(Arg) A34 adenosine deaminase TadA